MAREGKHKTKKASSSLDPDDVGFVRWRAAFYVAGKTVEALHNLLYLLDQFFVFANADREVRVVTRRSSFFLRTIHKTQFIKIPPTAVKSPKTCTSLYPYLGVDIGDVWDELQHHTIDKRTHSHNYKPFNNTFSP